MSRYKESRFLASAYFVLEGRRIKAQDALRRNRRRETTMQTSLQAVSAGFALTFALLSLTPVASAGPQEDLAVAVSSWARALGENDPERVLPFYANDAVLWGTLSPTVRTDRASLRDYFVTAFKTLPGLKVTFGDQVIRVYGTTAVNTGYYTFSYVQNGETKTLPARYSFTYVQAGDRWLIVDHHSSAMPPAPR
jgi:uncharacterized protein (TIGR02246 family)